jgi:hypothetical protein
LEVLHREAVRVKFNRNKIVSCKAVDRYKILNDIRRNQNIIKIAGMIDRRKVSMSSRGNRKQTPIIDDGALRGGITGRKDTRKNPEIYGGSTLLSVSFGETHLLVS